MESTLLPPTINKRLVARLVPAETIIAESTLVDGRRFFAPHAFPDLPADAVVEGISANVDKGYYVFILTHPSFPEIS